MLTSWVPFAIFDWERRWSDGFTDSWLGMFGFGGEAATTHMRCMLQRASTVASRDLAPLMREGSDLRLNDIF